ncbi:gamma-glutamyltransferase [Algoriphagus sp. D3-2-R+10]|uniref:gamma-glutamyltransferase n=1 Tax=Algoriphagus aurantiacus TaxID=3103948 RepID=UPI002B3CFDAA|nr:gamma-glutamyltransferase [Algoriphagus sp. D3-2-R+10]MEB2777415.1 gamma-glutamyltransferase [Algoriphagus sp. D3-2-R+10]
MKTFTKGNFGAGGFLWLAGIALFITQGCDPKKDRQIPVEQELGLMADSGMVVSAHWLASEVGVEILKKGGNAYDAAVAVQFALAVVYPRAGNIGGGGFAVYRNADGESGTLDFREKAPLGASRDMYLDSSGEAVKDLSLKGVLSVGVPGTVNGMVELHEKLGSMPWQELVEPSIRIAEKGLAISDDQANILNRSREDFIQYNRFSPEVIKTEEWQQGDTIRFSALAKTLTRIASEGNPGFYQGETARLIIEEMEAQNGMVTAEDLQRYRAVWREPVIGNYGDYKILAMPPPSSGGVAIVQLFNGLKEFDMDNYPPNSADAIHLFTELERRVYADRAENLGDPDFFKMPMGELLDDGRMKVAMESFDADNKTPSSEIKPGQVEIIESVETTHFSIVDRHGNAIAVTTTLNGYFGSKVMVRGAGFFLNNEMDDFSKKAGTPNQFGLVGGEANAILPEKRMLSSMSPTIVEKDGKVFAVLGSPGGSTIITSVFQTMVNVMVHGMTMREAVDAPRFHHQWLPDVILHERDGLDSLIQLQLENKGHSFQQRGLLGKVNAIKVYGDGKLEGAADSKRGSETAKGY